MSRESYEIYVINMPAQTGRLAHMQASLQSAGLTMRRIEAVTPDTCETIAADLGVDLGDRGKWSGTERAVFMSHVLAWKALLDSGRDWAVVLEDDVFVTHDARHGIETVARHSRAGLVRLETFGRTRCIVDRRGDHGPGFGATGTAPDGFSLFRFHGGSIGAAGYMIHRDAIRDMLDAGLSMDEPIDLQFFAHPIPRDPRQEVLWPAIVVQSDRLHESVWPAGCGWEDALNHSTFQSTIAHTPVPADRTDETLGGRLGKLRASILRKFQGRVRRCVPLSSAGPLLPVTEGPQTDGTGAGHDRQTSTSRTAPKAIPQPGPEAGKEDRLPA